MSVVYGTPPITQSTTYAPLEVLGPFNRTQILSVDASQLAAGEYISLYIEGLNTSSTPLITFGGWIKLREIIVPVNQSGIRLEKLVINHKSSAASGKTYVIEIT